MNFYATIAEHISVNRHVITSLSSDYGVHNIEIYINLNYELNNAGIKCPYVMDEANPQNNQGMIVDSIESQINKLNTFLYNIKYLWAVNKYGGINKTLLYNQVRTGLYKLFDKSALNELINAGVSTAYLDINKIINALNEGGLFYDKMVSLNQLKQLLDGVADKGNKTESINTNGNVQLLYKFNEGDSLNCILLVNDADVGSNIVNVDKWIITLIHQENIDPVIIIPYSTLYKYISNINMLVKNNTDNTFSVSFDNFNTWTKISSMVYSGMNFVEGKINNSEVVVYSNNILSVYVTYNGINYITITSSMPIIVIFYSRLFNIYYGISNDIYYYSTDLINWTIITDIIYNTTYGVYNFAENGNKLIVGAQVPLYTLNGITWNLSTFSPASSNIVLKSITNLTTSSGFLAYGINSVNGVAYNYISEDGITWYKKIYIPNSYIVILSYLSYNNSYVGVSLLNNNAWNANLSDDVIVYNYNNTYNILVNATSELHTTLYNIVLLSAADIASNSSLSLQNINLIN
jgi:hypothetical protein